MLPAGVSDEEVPPTPPRRKLLILDLNKVLLDSVRFSSDRPARSASFHTEGDKPGVFYGKSYGVGYMYVERPGLRRFLEECFKLFDVGIWTCAQKPRTKHMMELIFDEDERNQFKFVYTQEDATDSGVQRPDITNGRANIFFKDLRTVWNHFVPLYDGTNTILVDDSPFKTFVNADYNGLFANPFHHDKASIDTFLLEILWPYLSKVYHAYDARQYMETNNPKWSQANFDKSIDRYDATYKQVGAIWGGDMCATFTTFTVLDFIPEEIAWGVKADIQASPPFEEMSEEEIYAKWGSWIGTTTYIAEGKYRDEWREFVRKVMRMRDTTSKFKNIHAEDYCTRDRKYDPYGLRLTCTNAYCKYGDHDKQPRRA